MASFFRKRRRKSCTSLWKVWDTTRTEVPFEYTAIISVLQNTSLPDWDLGIAVENLSHRKEMGRFIVLSESPAGTEECWNITGHPITNIKGYWHCNLTTEEVQTAVLLLSHLSTNQSSAPTVLTSLPCLKNSSMICSLHILLRCRHREGLLMSAALIAICENCKVYNSGLKDVRNHLS